MSTYQPGATSNSFRLPFIFMFTGMFCLIVFQAAVFAAGADLSSGTPRSASGWSVAHLLVLGWASMVAMGAVYQLLNVVLNRKVFSTLLGYIHYASFTGGMAGLTIAFYKGNTAVLAISASVTLLGILLFVLNIGVTLLQAKQWNSITLHVASALFYLSFTAVSGLLMGLNFRFGFMVEWHERLLPAHIWSGFVGWFTLLIIGFSYKMLPMFYLSHNYPVRLQRVTLILFNAGILGMIAALLGGWPAWTRAIALFFLAAAALAYNIHASQIMKKKHKKHPGTGIRHTVYLIRTMLVLFLAALIWFLIRPEDWSSMRVLMVMSYAFFMGWVALTILGYLSKIAPFLWWTHKYGDMVGKGKVPSMSDLINERYVRVGLWAITIGITAVTAALATGSEPLLRGAQAWLSVSMISYIGLILNVFRH